MKIPTLTRPKMHFTCDHEWINYNDTIGYVGISAFKLKGVEKIESIKWHRQQGTVAQGVLVAEIYTESHNIAIHAPISCIILGPNPKFSGNLDLILESPEENGWVFFLSSLQFGNEAPLLSPVEYQELTSAENIS